MRQKISEQFSVTDIKEWLTVLDGLRQENIELKNRLSEAVRLSVSRAFIEEAELFQQRSIDKDQVIDLLRHDIAGLIMKMNFHDVVSDEGLVIFRQASVLQSDVQKLVSGFGQMKQSFDQYLSDGL